MEHIEVMRDKYARRVGEEIQQAVLQHVRAHVAECG
jgi:hypothetical protein